MISVYNQQKNLRFDKRAVKALIEATLSHLKISFQAVTVYFVSKKKITDLHDQFFQDPTPTDCISFPLDKEHLGEIFVCPKVAMEYAAQHDLDPYEETSLYIIHGLLHLIGYDDIDPEDRRTMRKNEKSCMDHLNKLKIRLDDSFTS